MKKEEIEKNLINSCRYYRGEDAESIYPENATALPNMERCWVMWMLDNTEAVNRALEEYNGFGLSDFKKDDDVPLTLKAVLFARYNTYEGRVDVEGFKAWYKQYYK